MRVLFCSKTHEEWFEVAKTKTGADSVQLVRTKPLAPVRCQCSGMKEKDIPVNVSSLVVPTKEGQYNI